jgi:hypothetical protein
MEKPPYLDKSEIKASSQIIEHGSSLMFGKGKRLQVMAAGKYYSIDTETIDPKTKLKTRPTIAISSRDTPEFIEKEYTADGIQFVTTENGLWITNLSGKPIEVIVL